MSYGTEFTADIFLSRERFNNEYELDSKIEETQEYIRVCREKILMACMGGKDSFHLLDEEDNPCDLVDVVHNRMNELLDWFIELQDRLYLYKLLKDNFDKRENV